MNNELRKQINERIAAYSRMVENGQPIEFIPIVPTLASISPPKPEGVPARLEANGYGGYDVVLTTDDGMEILFDSDCGLLPFKVRPDSNGVNDGRNARYCREYRRRKRGG